MRCGMAQQKNSKKKEKESQEIEKAAVHERYYCTDNESIYWLQLQSVAYYQ